MLGLGVGGRGMLGIGISCAFMGNGPRVVMIHGSIVTDGWID